MKIFIMLIRLYRLCITPFLGPCCRFYPSCSLYAEEVLLRHGLWRGLLLSLKRLIKCFPWHPGGYDPPP